MTQYITTGMPESRPVGLGGALGRVLARVVPKATKGTSTILKTSGKWVEPAHVARVVPDVLHSGATFGAKIPGVTKAPSTIDVFETALRDVQKSSLREAQATIQKAFKIGRAHV